MPRPTAEPSRSAVHVHDPRPEPLPVGPRLEAVLEVAYRARRPVLLEGPTGIGKSDVVRGLAARLGIETVVLDLSLLEPPDLIGLPIVENGITRYAPPRILPQSGAGILMLEELNRAERYIQQPALQLLSARTLHEYVLPDGWVVFAAINPESGEYQVTPLDPALRARFANLRVRADRANWLAWAVAQDLHPAVLALARAHERILEDVPPRTWTYVAETLSSMHADELRDEVLLRDVLGGFLPAAWVEALVAAGATSHKPIEIDVRAALRSYHSDDASGRAIARYKAEGDTDRLAEIAARLGSMLGGPEIGVMAARKEISLDALEALLGDLPGDHRERLSEALARNATALPLLDVTAKDVLSGWERHPARTKVEAWKRDPTKHARIGLLVTAVSTAVQSPAMGIELKKSNPMRASLGHFLAQVGGTWGMPLVDALRRVGVTPIRPET